MDVRRLLRAVVAAFVVLVPVDFLIHEVWLGGFYRQHPEWWLPAAEMKARMPFMFLSHLALALFLALVYAKGYEEDKGRLSQGVRFGIVIGLLLQVPKQLMLYFVYPYPVSLLMAWGVGGLVETMLVGAALGALYRET